jgi:hypothetical protein
MPAEAGIQKAMYQYIHQMQPDFRMCTLRSGINISCLRRQASIILSHWIPAQMHAGMTEIQDSSV